MHCPFCTTPKADHKTKVVDSRDYWDPNKRCFYVERKRKCYNCERVFKTTERSPCAPKIETTLES